MGYDPNIAAIAAKLYPYDLHQAIDYIEAQNTSSQPQNMMQHQFIAPSKPKHIVNKDSIVPYNDGISNITSKAARKIPPKQNTMSNNSIHNIVQEFKQNQEEVSCPSIDKCFALDRLVFSLRFYQKINEEDTETAMNELSQYVMTNGHYIINDYHHMLSHHLNEDNVPKSFQYEQFKCIYNKIMNDKQNQCDVTKCKIFVRNNRQRETNKISKYVLDPAAVAMIDTLDSIHCYFIHSVDIGYRIVTDITDTNNNDDEKDAKICHDKELRNLRQYLSSKREKLKILRGDNRFANNKFMTTIADS